ncbi:MAG: D-inositol-3-phosphate glycosyltransferase, partial [Gordonia sp. (in: high G+C Gram-positive bacteria)]
LGVAVYDGRTGALVDGHRTCDWSNALEKMLADPARLSAMGGAARTHAERFSWDRTADGLLASYTRALDERAALRHPTRATARKRWRRRGRQGAQL